MDEKKLIKYAVDYLSKYDSSKSNLIEILKRKIFRLNLSGIEKSRLINLINVIILKLENNNLINDKRYSFSRISSLSRAGKSKKFIFNYLMKKGVDKYDIQNNLKNFQESNLEWELESAKLFAKKKKLYESSDSYEKKLAKMARAGFSYEIAKKILEEN